jgi:hypothetical protein
MEIPSLSMTPCGTPFLEQNDVRATGCTVLKDRGLSDVADTQIVSAFLIVVAAVLTAVGVGVGVIDQTEVTPSSRSGIRAPALASSVFRSRYRETSAHGRRRVVGAGAPLASDNGARPGLVQGDDRPVGPTR